MHSPDLNPEITDDPGAPVARIMALDLKNQYLGCAFHSSDSNIIYFLAEDQHETGPHYDLLHALLGQIEPNIVKTSIRAGIEDENWIGSLQSYSDSIELQTGSASDFSCQAVLDLFEQSTAASTIDMIANPSNILSAGCVGALMTMICKSSIKVEHFSMYVVSHPNTL